VFHIDPLTPYRETITHGPNYQHPLPDLVDGEEEYSVERILDSWLFGRRQCLQYLVKWDGYLDSDNMWVNKDDVFADNKVQEFKQSNPDKQVHIRTLHYVDSLDSPTPTTTHLLTQHAHRYMSSNGHNDLAHEYWLEHIVTPPIGMSYSTTSSRQLLMLPPTILPNNSDSLDNQTCSTNLMSLWTPMLSHLSPDPPLCQHNLLPTPLGSSPSTLLLDLPPTEPLLLKLSKNTHMKFPSPLLQSLGMQMA
jgi:hypothetical protein